MARSNHPWRRMERNIIIYVKREYLGHTLEELANEYGISTNRIAQIVKNVYYRDKHGDDDYVTAIDNFMRNPSGD